MGIEDDDIARVRDASDIVQVIGEYTTMRRVGRRWQALCPFHGEKTPSFSVNHEQGLYYCFGCGAKGDVITFVREKEHLDFVAAVEKLAARAGVTLRYTDEHEGANRRRRQLLVEAVERAIDWYHERLLAAPDAAPARRYLRSRGLTGEEVRRYRLGWAPEGWDELARVMTAERRGADKNAERSSGVSPDVFIDAGLGFRNRANRLTDAFRGRVLFPIYDVNGAGVGFGGRLLPGAEGPKYKNSAESALYAKSKLLYGLNWAKGGIVAAGEVIVCEGYTDVMGFARAGVERAVATCGTALTEEHVRVLTAYAKRIVLAFDADAAGQGAAARFYEWERRFDVDVAVAALPAGVDPADLAASDPDALRAAVEEARPFLGFRVERILDSASMATPESRARAAESVLDAIREHPSSLVRDQYVMEVASRTQIDPDRLRADLDRSGRSGQIGSARRSGGETRDGTDGDPGPGGIWMTGRSGPDGSSRAGRPPARPAVDDVREGPELEALRLLIICPDDIAAWLHDGLFSDERTLAAYRALRDSPDVRAAIDSADPAAADLLRRVLVTDTDAQPDDVVDLLVRAATNRVLAAYRARRDRGADPDVLAAYAAAAQAKLQVEALGDPASREEARDQLLAWLLQESEERE